MKSDRFSCSSRSRCSTSLRSLMSSTTHLDNPLVPASGMTRIRHQTPVPSPPANPVAGSCLGHQFGPVRPTLARRLHKAMEPRRHLRIMVEPGAQQIEGAGTGQARPDRRPPMRGRWRWPERPLPSGAVIIRPIGPASKLSASIDCRCSALDWTDTIRRARMPPPSTSAANRPPVRTNRVGDDSTCRQNHAPARRAPSSRSTRR